MRNFTGLLLKYAFPGKTRKAVDTASGVAGVLPSGAIGAVTGAYGAATGAWDTGNAILNNVTYHGVPLSDFITGGVPEVAIDRSKSLELEDPMSVVSPAINLGVGIASAAPATAAVGGVASAGLAGYAAGRYIGQNVEWDGRNLDSHVQDSMQGVMDRATPKAQVTDKYVNAKRQQQGLPPLPPRPPVAQPQVGQW